MTLFVGTLRAQTGKYSETASRTIDPMTMKGMVTSPNYLATQAGVDVLRAGADIGETEALAGFLAALEKIAVRQVVAQAAQLFGSGPHCLFGGDAGVLGAVAAIAGGFGYDFNLSEETLQQAAAGAVAVVGIVNAVMHVVTSKKVGLPSNGGN